MQPSESEQPSLEEKKPKEPKQSKESKPKPKDQKWGNFDIELDEEKNSSEKEMMTKSTVVPSSKTIPLQPKKKDSVSNNFAFLEDNKLSETRTRRITEEEQCLHYASE